MPQKSWSHKRERQYEHIKDGLVERGLPKEAAEEIAARTVNKERARTEESQTASRSSTQDLSPGQRGPTITSRLARAYQGPALQRGKEMGYSWSFKYDQGGTGKRGR